VKREDREQLRAAAALALAATRCRALTGANDDDWEIQTSNSFRRIGVHGGGDGDVLCATTHRYDGHPDLLAPRGVLEYIVSAQPCVVIELLDRLDAVEAELEMIAAVELAKIAAITKEPR